jgi:hypothetical protein
MRLPTRLVAITLWTCLLAAIPAHADDNPRTHLEGYRCEVLPLYTAWSTAPTETILACQILDDGVPTGTARSRELNTSAIAPIPMRRYPSVITPTRPSHDTSRPWHRTVVPTPTP